MRQELLDKYNVPVPRYTSYPPANFFESDFNERLYLEAIESSNHQTPEELSFYFHIPFCQKLCHYCGCNSYPYTDQKLTDNYVKALHQEIDLITQHLNPDRRIAQIHFGGGTPSLLQASDIKSLNDHLLSKFEVIESPEIAIECHPGWLDESKWEELTHAGFTRYSIGVQDLDLKVLNAVNRQPSLIPVEEIVSFLHNQNVRVNMDLLYGLPFQTEDSFAETIRKVIDMKPDRLVTFSYAHVPWAFPRQQVLEKAGLPESKEKSRMFEKARQLLLEADYKPIGLDHFVRYDDELYTALQEGQLHRNFQGYCTRRTTGQVYAFGVTGISQLSAAYSQNTKDIQTYIDTIEKGLLPVSKGYKLTTEQQITRKVIETLMCNYQLRWQDIADSFSVSVKEIKSQILYNEKLLETFANDGIIIYDDQKIKMTEDGALFVRNVAASFDPLMKRTDKAFSKPV